MKIKTDFSELWEQVDRIVENRLPPENDMKKDSAYDHVNSLIEYKAYSTFESKEQLDKMANHATQLLENLEKPALNNELKSESSHEMEL